MPITIGQDNFDSYTNGSSLNGQGSWVADTAYTISNAQSVSSPNSTQITGTASPARAYWNVLDGNAGSMQVQTAFNFVAFPAASPAGLQLVGRWQSPGASESCYMVLVEPSGGGTPGVRLFKGVSGTFTQLGSTIVGTNIANATWYVALLILNGTTIQVQITRNSDGFYLTSLGAFQSGQAFCFNTTDSSVTGQGVAGYRSFITSGAVTIAHDDFLYQSLAVATTPQIWPYLDTGLCGSFCDLGLGGF